MCPWTIENDANPPEQEWGNVTVCEEWSGPANVRCVQHCQDEAAQKGANWTCVSAEVQELWCKNCDDAGAGGTTDAGSGDAGTAGSAQCNDWDPSSALHQIGRVLHIDGTFYTDLLRDTSPLVFCDGAWWFQSRGGFELHSASPDDLFYELGLRNGDRPVSIAGFPLQTLDDVGTAFAALKNRTGEPLTLRVSRNGSTISLTYQIDR